MSGLAALGTKRFNLDAIPNLKGRVAVVTGGTAGIGQSELKAATELD